MTKYIEQIPNNELKIFFRCLMFPNLTDEELADYRNWFDSINDNHSRLICVYGLFPYEVLSLIKDTDPQSRIDFIKDTSFNKEETDKYTIEYPIKSEFNSETGKFTYIKTNL